MSKKQLLILIIFNSIIFCALSQSSRSINWPRIEDDINISDSRIINKELIKQPVSSTHNFDSKNCFKDKNTSLNQSFNSHQIDSYGAIRNITVSRGPIQLLITDNDKYACVRSFLSNTIEIINISTGKIVESFNIPMPHDFLLSHSGSKLIVASLTDRPMPSDPPLDDCSGFAIGLTGFALLTTIDITLMEIIKIDTIETPAIASLLQSSEDSIIYLQDYGVTEFNLLRSKITNRWPLSKQIWSSEIDNKNKRIFLTTTQDSLIVIDLKTKDIFASQYYSNGDVAYPFYIGLDTLSNRVFIQGKLQPQSEVLVFDAVSLDQLHPIDNTYLNYGNFLACPDLGSIFIGAGYPNNTLELDYVTLHLKQTLPLSLHARWHTLTISEDKSTLFSFQYGGAENTLSHINPPQYLDISTYDVNTGYVSQYTTTDNKYACSYARSIATTKNGQYLIITNSPENTISILEISYEGIDLPTNSNFMEVYPNPSSNVIKVSINKQLDSDFTIEIYNFLGCLLSKITKIKSETNFEMDLTMYPKGQYFIHFESGQLSYSKKIIKN